MIPQKIQALFDFIDFLDANKKEYIEKYIPLCNELSELDKQRSKLKPNENYKDKQSYECIQKEIKEKFEPITDNIYKPVTNKLRELGIWSRDDV
jgi:FtsZ-binding cell division protein ZapB